MSRQLDLFGKPLPAAPRKRSGGTRKPGYPERPGSGPKGKRCRACVRCIEVKPKPGAVHKCEVTASIWDKPGTEIHLFAPACSLFQARPFQPLKEAV